MRRGTTEPGIRVWRLAAVPEVTLKRIEGMQIPRTTYSEAYAIVSLLEGAYDSWYQGERLSHAAGELRFKEPGLVSRGLRIVEPVTLQIAAFSPTAIERAAGALGRRASLGLGSSCLSASSPTAKLGLAMHAALLRNDASELELATLVTETLAEVMLACNSDTASAVTTKAPLAVRRARELLHDSFASKVTLDALADHAALDKYHLVRAFRRAIGLPPYEYLTHIRVSRAATLLARGLSASAVAQAVGLYDESQLSRHFRRIVGMTPGRYAKELRGTSTRQHHPRQSRAVATNFGP